MLTDDVERYIGLRQTLGFQLRKPARHLRIFARVATEKGETLIRAATVIEWAAAAPTLDARNHGIGDGARFARFLRAEDSRHEVPPTGLFATPKLRPTPYIILQRQLPDLGTQRLHIDRGCGRRRATRAECIRCPTLELDLPAVT